MPETQYYIEKLSQYNKPAQELTYTEMLFLSQISGEFHKYAEGILKEKESALANSVRFLRDVSDRQTRGFGQCGENLFWKIEGGVLRIGGEGAMWDFGTGTQEDRFPIAPWRKKSNYFRHVAICEGVTSIGICAFEGMELNDIRIPAGLEVIKERAFSNTSIKHLVLPNTINTLEPNIIVSQPCRVDSLTVAVSIPNIQPEAFRNLSYGPWEITLTGELPEDLSALVESNLFHFLGHWIYYPKAWDLTEESFYEKLCKAIGAYGEKHPDTNFDENYYAKLKDNLSALPY